MDPTTSRQRLQSATLSRRRALTGVSAGALALAAGCSSSKTAAPANRGQKAASSSATAGAATQPKRGGTLNHANSQETRGETFDPATTTPLKGEGYRLFYQGLLNYHPVTYEVRPELAQKWEQPSPTEYLFTLQPGVKWHDKPPASGRPLAVEDVVFSLNRARSKDPLFTASSLLDSVDQIQTVDQSRVRVTAKYADAPLLSKLSSDQFEVLAPEVVDKAGKFATADTAVGTGPFVLQSSEQKVGAQLVRNPAYWKPNLPYLDGLRTFHLGDGSPGDQVAWSAFLAGRLHVAVVPGNEAKTFIAQQPKGYTPAWYSDPTGWFTTPNTRVKPFDDARVTRALNLLQDHSEWITAWSEQFGGRGRLCSVLPPALEAWDLAEDDYKKYSFWKQPRDDAAKEALSLLSAAGFTKDSPLKFELDTSDIAFGQAAVQLLQAQWRRLSGGVVDVTLKILDQPAFQSIRANRSFAFGEFSNLASFNEPDVNFNQMFRTGASRNYWNYSDAALDTLFDKQRAIFDVPQRKAAIKDIIVYMIDHFPGVIGAGRYFLATTRPEVRGFFPEQWLHGSQYEQLWLDA